MKEDSNINDLISNINTKDITELKLDKISLLMVGNRISVNDVLKYVADKNKGYVEDNCKFLSEYLAFLDK